MKLLTATPKSLADLKRVIRQPGLVIHVVQHWQPHLCGTSRKPKALRSSGKRGIQTNGYYFDAIGRDGKLEEMWAPLPPASELRFNEDGTVTFHPDSERGWTLRFDRVNG